MKMNHIEKWKQVSELFAEIINRIVNEDLVRTYLTIRPGEIDLAK